MKKRKILLGLALAAAAVFSLSACGDDAEPTTPDTAEKSGDSSQSGSGQQGGESQSGSSQQGGESQGSGSGQQSGGSEVTIEKYTVTFNSLGGSDVTSVEVNKDEKVAKPTDPVKNTEGDTKYEFAGWFKEEACTNEFDFENTPITSNTTLYAKWEATNKVSIVFANSTIDTVKVFPGEKVARPTNPTKDSNYKYNYTFDNWYADEACTTLFDFNSEITESVHVYAKYYANMKEKSVWNNVELGTHTGNGTFNYTEDGKSIVITGAGDSFGKDTNAENCFYSYVNVKGTTTVIAKITPDANNTTGVIGIIAKNDATEAGSMAAGVYYDYSKSQIRVGRHGGAANLSAEITSAFYVKLEFSEGACYYTLANDKDFTDVVVARNGMGVTGLDPKTVGFIAGDNDKVTFSDISIVSSYTDDGASKTKIAFSSVYGEMALEHLNSKSYNTSGTYSSTYNQVISQDTISVSHATDGTNKGNVREDKQLDYLLLDPTSEDMSITADVVITSINNGTDKQGFGIGQFSIVDGQKVALNILHYQKNLKFQQSYTTAQRGSGNSGNPQANAPIADEGVGITYTVSYIKSNNKAYFKVVNSSGVVLIDEEAGSLDLTTANADLLSGKTVQYGFVFSGVECKISNIVLSKANGQIVYESNDYYIAEGVAPTISNATATVSSDRTKIDLKWDITEAGSGAVKYGVYVSVDGGNYTKINYSKTNSFTYTGLAASGTYKFKIVPIGGDNEGTAIETVEVNYVKPLEKASVTASATGTQVTINWEAVTDATKYDLYRALGNSGEFEKIADDLTVLTYVDTNVTAEESYKYYIVAENDTNSSNPSDYAIAVVSTGHVGDYVYEDAAAKITIVDKSDDTLFTNAGSLTLKSDKAGTAVLKINNVEKSSTAVTADTNFELALELVNGRNDVEVLLTDADGNITRTIFNFVVNPSIDAKVDQSYTGEDGAVVGGVKMYKTIEAAVNAVPSTNASSYVIYVLNGTYNERVTVESPYVSLLGQDARKTKIAYNACIAAKTATSMWDRNVVYVDSTADGFTAENITIENTFPYTNGSDQQADALCIVADQTVCINVRLIGYQDTLLTDSRIKVSGNYEKTRQYFEKCYITGNVDFIYGSGSSYFYDCDIVARYTSYKSDGCYTAARTYDYTDYGFVFNSCRFLAEDGVSADSYRLARPWGADASTIFIDCYMGKAIPSTTSPYGDMSGNSYKNARFAERGSYGEGYAVSTDRPYLSSTESTAALDGVIKGFDYVAVKNSLYTEE